MRMAFPLTCSAFQCGSRYDFEYENFMSLSYQYFQRHCFIFIFAF